MALLMDGGTVETVISTYQNDMTSFSNRDDVLTMLIHLGYLRYDLETGTVVIPNNEIKDEFKTSTRFDEWVDTFRSFKKSQEKNYPQKLAHYQGNILLISVYYEKDLSSTEENYKHHSCKIERV